MAISPTTWNPADKGYHVTLSNGNLTTAYANYTQNRVRAVTGVTTGKWYWEVTLDSADDDCRPMLGATAGTIFAGNNTQEAGELYVGTGGFAPGDVFGVAFDADAGTIDITRNGVARASVSGLTISEPWHPSCGGYDWGTLGDTTAFTANFGGSAFAYTPPAGYTAGIGAVAHSITGTCTTQYGTPTIDYPPIISGTHTTQYGTPSAQQKFPVDSLLPTSRVGTPHLMFPQGGQVTGTCTTQYGTPKVPITLPPPNQICSVTGTHTTQYGTPTANTAITVQVTGTCSTAYGTPRAGQGYAVAGSRSTQYGVHGLTLGLPVAGASTTRVGSPTLRMGLPVTGSCTTRYGVPVAHAVSVHHVSGTCNTQIGTPRVNTMTCKVFSLPPGTRIGSPFLKAQPC